jgi:hypothetical protein
MTTRETTRERACLLAKRRRGAVLRARSRTNERALAVGRTDGLGERREAAVMQSTGQAVV